MSTAISLRKTILLHRSALLSAWPRHFPKHDFMTLRLVQAAPIIPWANEAAWAESARNYHRDRKQMKRMR
jgi:hypothetical protein